MLAADIRGGSKPPSRGGCDGYKNCDECKKNETTNSVLAVAQVSCLSAGNNDNLAVDPTIGVIALQLVCTADNARGSCDKACNLLGLGDILVSLLGGDTTKGGCCTTKNGQVDCDAGAAYCAAACNTNSEDFDEEYCDNNCCLSAC